MKKILLAFVALFIGINVASAQSPFGKGTSAWNVGIGVSDGYLPLSASYEYGIAGGLFDGKGAAGLGLYGGVLVGKEKSYFAIAPKAALHYNFTPAFDGYLSLLLGYSSASENFAWGTHVGCRYFFTPTVGMFAEAGYGFSFLNLGVTFKM